MKKQYKVYHFWYPVMHALRAGSQHSLTVHVCILLAVAGLLTGCSVENTDPVKLKDLEFTVVENAEVPEELLTIIEEKKAANFKLTYEDGGYLYIVAGYGEQNTGGYSIAVNELFLTSNAIYIDTNLIGPSKDEKITEAASYPYIVIKTEYLDKSVVFQ
ncbi:protease complex subunit PrcB family protein [Diplocloster modestus]|nr:protease complex subunit PrcB family protein [Diplocloster modestus]